MSKGFSIASNYKLFYVMILILIVYFLCLGAKQYSILPMLFLMIILVVKLTDIRLLDKIYRFNNEKYKSDDEFYSLCRNYREHGSSFLTSSIIVGATILMHHGHNLSGGLFIIEVFFVLCFAGAIYGSYVGMYMEGMRHMENSRSLQSNTK